jgi:hypothetical protein
MMTTTMMMMTATARRKEQHCDVNPARTLAASSLMQPLLSGRHHPSGHRRRR